MVSARYAKNHIDWDESPQEQSWQSSAFVQMMFGSCTGVVDAASILFNTGQSCNGGYNSELRGKRTSRRNWSPSLRKSDELLEIPEFFAADLTQGRRQNASPTDDVSALSSYTLDEMAQQKVVPDIKRSQALRTHGTGPSSPTSTEISEDLPVPNNYIYRYDIDAAPMSGMLVNPTQKSTKPSHSETSLSTLGFD